MYKFFLCVCFELSLIHFKWMLQQRAIDGVVWWSMSCTAGGNDDTVRMWGYVCVWAPQPYIFLQHKQPHSVSLPVRWLFLSWGENYLPPANVSPLPSLTAPINYWRFSYFRFHLHSSSPAGWHWAGLMEEEEEEEGGNRASERRAERLASWLWGPWDGSNWIARPLIRLALRQLAANLKYGCLPSYLTPLAHPTTHTPTVADTHRAEQQASQPGEVLPILLEHQSSDLLWFFFLFVVPCKRGDLLPPRSYYWNPPPHARITSAGPKLIQLLWVVYF